MEIKRYSNEEIADIYHSPLLQLINRASAVHQQHHTANEVQVSSLISIKTGGCPEDCAYCPQAARYQTDVEVNALMKLQEVVDLAKKAKDGGASRLCMGAAWREVRDNRDFDKVINMVKAVNNMDMEVCCTLGMLSYEQALKLKEAGLFAYNHNVDTSEEHYQNIISTRNIEDRLNTLDNVRRAKLTVCSGGIVGLGESHEDRIKMLHLLSHLPQHPESVPINALVPVKGTPLEDAKPVSIWDMLRMIATTRIIMPTTMVRLSAGRNEMSMSEQALCFLAGANSIFSGEKLLTTPNPDLNSDMQMFDILGIKPRAAFKGTDREKQLTHS